MADQNQTNGAGKGRGRAGDQTSQPGQAEGLLPFGIKNSTSTGLPGTDVGHPGPGDPTTVPGQVPSDVFGQPTATKTGMAGSTGASTSAESGASYTDPFAFLGGGSKGDASGGSTETESQANHYGDNTMVGIEGAGQPTSTGVNQGHLLIGGNKVGN
jgi:hypothetical protein